MNQTKNTINIAIVGLGGQGIITLSKLIINTYIQMGQKACMNEIHGLSQRGGSVQSLLRIGDSNCPVFASNDTDFIIGLEKMETIRYLYTAKKAKAKVFLANYYEIRNTADLGLEVFPKNEIIDKEIEKYVQEMYIFETLDFEKSFKPKFKPVNVAVFSALTEIPELNMDKNLAKKVMLDILGKNIILKRINERAFDQGTKWIKKRVG